MAGSKKGKKIEEIEYNVMNGGFDKNGGSLHGAENSGCAAAVLGIIIIAVICFFAFGFAHRGNGGPDICCAEKGCSRAVRAGSNYCWLHSGSSVVSPRKKNQTNTQNKKKTPDNSQKSWGGGNDENEKNNDSSSGTGSEKSSSDSSQSSAERSNSGKVSY